MNKNQTIFVIDAGNTLLKVGIFRNQVLDEVKRLSISEIDSLSALIKSAEDKAVIISSVLSDSLTKTLKDIFVDSILFTNSLRLPINITYQSPETLGADRICNSVASYSLAKGKNVLSIDIGTCIKFDFTDQDGNYRGGSISPGIDLRYKSMNDYTGKLPLLTDKFSNALVGVSTIESLRSGVMNGIKAEIDQFIFLYSQQYQDLTFFVTGGDAVYFDFSLKNNTFVDENLTIKGLYQIYLFNAK